MKPEEAAKLHRGEFLFSGPGDRRPLHQQYPDHFKPLPLRKIKSPGIIERTLRRIVNWLERRRKGY